MKHANLLVMVAVIIVLALSITGLSAVPQVINYQGWLTDAMGDPIPDGNYQITFTIWNDESASAPTNELWTSGPQTVSVEGGLLTYQLGSVPPYLPHDIFTDTLCWLGIKVGADPEISPRTKLTSVPYAYHALRADSSGYAFSIADNSVTSGKIVDGTIINDDVSPSADIAVDKISGTAVNLSSVQTIIGDKTFEGETHFCDSSMIVDDNGVALGSFLSPTGYMLLYALRWYDTTDTRYGVRADIYNYDAGELYGVWGQAYHMSTSTPGNAYGVYAQATSDGNVRYGVLSTAEAVTENLTTGSSYGVLARGRDGDVAYGLYAIAQRAVTNWAGYFDGDVRVIGTLDDSKSTTRIDHPLDPENKILYHSKVSSPEMLNIYNGNAIFDGNGEAIVELPEYFEALNTDFRYQLTCIGEFSQVYIAEEITNNQFIIAGGRPGMKVSWEVTGIRKDPYAVHNPILTEVEKDSDEKGLYINPDAYGLDKTYSIEYHKHRAPETSMPERSE